jgi:hypothetical protein
MNTGPPVAGTGAHLPVLVETRVETSLSGSVNLSLHFEIKAHLWQLHLIRKLHG